MSDDLKEGFIEEKKMENRLDDLFLRFQTKGFMPIEIPGLIKDVFNYLLSHSISTLLIIWNQTYYNEFRLLIIHHHRIPHNKVYCRTSG